MRSGQRSKSLNTLSDHQTPKKRPLQQRNLVTFSFPKASRERSRSEGLRRSNDIGDLQPLPLKSFLRGIPSHNSFENLYRMAGQAHDRLNFPTETDLAGKFLFYCIQFIVLMRDMTFSLFSVIIPVK